MEIESPNKAHHSSMIITAFVFFFGGFILTGAEIICMIAWHSIRDNPLPSQLDVFRFIALSPVFVLVITLSYYTYSIFLGAVVAVVSQWIWGRVPFYSLIIMLPLCIFALYKQLPDGLTSLNYVGFFWYYSPIQLPVLLGCWWLSNRASK